MSLQKGKHQGGQAQAGYTPRFNGPYQNRGVPTQPRSDVYLPAAFTHQGGAGSPSLRTLHPGPPPPPHHAGALGGLGQGGGAGPQGGGGGVGGGAGGGPAQAPTPPGPSPHDMAKQGGGPPPQSPHMGAQPQMPGASGISMSFSISNQQRPSGPQTQYFRTPNPHRMMANPRSQVMNPNGVGQIGFQQMSVSPAFPVVPQIGTQPPVYMPQWFGGQPRQPGGFTAYPTSTQTPVIFQQPMYQFVPNQSPQNQFYLSQIVRPGAAGASSGGGGHGGTPPQQQPLQQQSPVQLQQQAVVGGGGGPGGSMSMGGGGPSNPVGMGGGVLGPVNVSGVVSMGGGVGGQPSGQAKQKPRTHALRVVDPVTGADVIHEMLKSEENRGATSESSARTEKSMLIAEFAAKVAKVAASPSESETPAPQPQPSDTSSGGTIPQISGAMNGPSESLYSIPSENIGPSQLGMNALSEPWKQTSDKERDPAMEPSICDAVIQKTVIEPVAVTKPEPVKEEKMPESVPVVPLIAPELQQPTTPVVSARGGGIRVPSPVAATVVSAVVKQPPAPVVSPPPAVQADEIPAVVPSMILHSLAQPVKELAVELPVKHQVPPPKSMQTTAHKPAPAATSMTQKGNESTVTKKALPASREGSSERKKVNDSVPKEEKKEEKIVEQTILPPVEEPLPQRQQLQTNGDEGLDGKPTQRPKTKKVHKNRELNRKGAEKEGTDMDAFSDAQQQQQKEAAAAAAAAAASAAAAAATAASSNIAAPAPAQRIETPTPPPTATLEKVVVNEVGKIRTITPPPSNQIPTAPAKTSALPPSTAPKGAAATTNENVPVQVNSNSSAKNESHPPKVPSSKPGIERNRDNKFSSLETSPVVPEQNFVGKTTSQGDEVEKEVAVEKVTEDSELDVSKVKINDTNEDNEESKKVEKDLSSVEKIDKQEEIDAVKNSENAMVSAVVAPVEEKKSVEEDTTNKKTPNQEADSTPAAPTPIIENAATDAASKLKQKNLYKEDQWSPFNPQGKKKYERDFLLGLQNDPQSMKKPENLPDIDIVLKDSTNRMQSRPVDLKTIGNLSRSSQQDFAPCFVKCHSGRVPAPKRNSQQGKPKGPKIMHVTISWNEDVKLHEAENAWKPRTKVPKDTQRKEAEDLYGAMRGILNKLTPQNFEKLVQQVLKLPIDTMDKLKGVINLVFDKAVDEPNFSVAYAELCNYLNNANIARQAQKGEDSNNNFRKILLKRCQSEFEKDKAAELGLSEKLKEIEKETSEEKKKELRLIMEEDERRMRRKSVGVTRFIGELYKLGMINQSIMVTCITELLDSGDEESLECLCKLLTTVGKVLEETLEKKASSGGQNPPNLNQYFGRMKGIVNERKTSSRVRFMLQDVIDLKNCKWVPRRDEANPKKIDQINMEAEREIMEQSQLTAAYSPMQSRGSMGGGRGGKDDRGKRNDDWCTVPPRNSRIVVDSHKLKCSATETNDLQLGSRNQHSMWSRGASGGSTSLGVNDRKANLFNVLGEVDSMNSGGRRAPMRHKEYAQGYTKSGSTSSINVVPSEEKERALAAVRKNVGGAPQANLENTRLRGGQPSKIPSRDSSVVSEDNTRTSSAPNANAAEPSQSKAPAHMPPDKVEKLCKLIFDDYMSSLNAKEAYGYMKDDLPAANYIDFLQFSLEKVLESSTVLRQNFARLVVYLISNQLFNKQLFVESVNKLLSFAEDMLIDVPKFWDYVAEMLAVLFEEDAMPLSSLQDFTSQLQKISLSGPLIVAVLGILFKTKGPAWIREKWVASSLQWSDLIAPEHVDTFVKDHGLEYVMAGSNRGFPKSGGIDMEEVKRKLNEFLKSNVSHDSIFEWIDGNIHDKTSEPSFIRALTTAVFESSIENNLKVKETVLQQNARLLQKYLNNNEQCELQILYAIQALVHKLEHPKGLILKTFEFLHNDDLISQESFIAWETSLDEPDGKAVALKSLTQFFTYLTEAEELDSNEEN